MSHIDNKFTFEIKDLFENTINSLPLQDETLIKAFNLGAEFMDVSDEINKIRKI